MRVLAASFDTEAAAEVVRAGLARLFRLKRADLEVAALGRAAEPDGPAAVLAGHFLETDVARATAFIQREGGLLLTNVDGSRTER
jgi:hypothetical protein